MNKKLPAITHHNRSLYIGLGYLLFCLIYLGAPRLSWRPILRVPSTWIDSFIPFIPITIWIYFSQFVLLFCGIWHAPNTKVRVIAFYSALLATTIAGVIFIILPTELPRYNIEAGAVTLMLWKALYTVDLPTNCFPSLHAALSTIAAFSLYQRGGFYTTLSPLWVIAIIFAALATKQHFILDILGGLLLSLPCLWIVNRCCKDYQYV